MCTKLTSATAGTIAPMAVTSATALAKTGFQAMRVSSNKFSIFSRLPENVQTTIVIPDQPSSTEDYDYLEETTIEDKLLDSKTDILV